jgi:hypothetical protein
VCVCVYIYSALSSNVVCRKRTGALTFENHFRRAEPRPREGDCIVGVDDQVHFIVFFFFWWFCLVGVSRTSLDIRNAALRVEV